MREIKFLAWDTHEEVISRVDYIDFAQGVIGLSNENVRDYEQPIHRVKLLQYTGLEDKNGKEIYEGYLLNMHYRNESVEKGKVVSVKMGMTYDSDGWEHERTYGWVAGNNSLADVAPYAEVLGNIHEHPELLEEED